MKEESRKEKNTRNDKKRDTNRNQMKDVESNVYLPICKPNIK